MNDDNALRTGLGGNLSVSHETSGGENDGAEEAQAKLTVTLADDPRIAGEWPITIRATALEEGRWPVVSEATVVGIVE